MTKHDDTFFLLHIADALSDIISYTSVGRADFYAERMRQDAVERKFEILGEAVKSLSPEIRGKYPQIKWSYMARFRDMLSHHYFGIDLATVWEISQKDVKDVLAQIVELKEYSDALARIGSEKINALDILLQNREAIHTAIKKYGIADVYAYGETASRTEKPDSDIELFCRIPEKSTYGTLVSLQDELTVICRRRVVISTPNCREYKESPERFKNAVGI